MGYNKKGKSEAGQGGKLGHSNMSHWEPSEWYKESSRVRRRHQDKEAIVEGEMDSREICFRYDFIRELTEEEGNTFWGDFIEAIEKRELSFGGGSGPTYLSGCLDLSISTLTIDQGVRVLRDFAEQYGDIIVEVNIETPSGAI